MDVDTFVQNATVLTDEETLPTVVEAVMPLNEIAEPIFPVTLRGAVVAGLGAVKEGVHVPLEVNVHMSLPPDCENVPPVALAMAPVVAEIITLPELPLPPFAPPFPAPPRSPSPLLAGVDQEPAVVLPPVT